MFIMVNFVHICVTTFNQIYIDTVTGLNPAEINIANVTGVILQRLVIITSFA